MSRTAVQIRYDAPIFLNMKTNLQKAVENLYKVFAKYSLKQKIEGCPCCVGKRDSRVLHLKNLHELSGAELSYFGFKAMTTFGDVEDFKHFLPRLFEIIVENDFDYDEEILFGKLDYAKWRTWAKVEQDAIEHFFTELLRFALNSETKNAYLIETYFVGIANVVEDITPYLNLWIENLNEPKIRNLAYFIIEDGCGLSNAFLQNRLSQRRQIKDWLLSATTIETLENLFFVENLPNAKGNLAKILDYIYEFQKEENQL